MVKYIVTRVDPICCPAFVYVALLDRKLEKKYFLRKFVIFIDIFPFLFVSYL